MSESVGGSQASDAGGWGGADSASTHDSNGFADTLDRATETGFGQTNDAGWGPSISDPAYGGGPPASVDPGPEPVDPGVNGPAPPAGFAFDPGPPTPAPPDPAAPAPQDAAGSGAEPGTAAVAAWSYRLNELAVADPDWPEGSLVSPEGDVLVPAWWLVDPDRPDEDLVFSQALLPALPGAAPPPYAAPMPPEIAAGMARALQRGFEAIGRAMIGIGGDLHDMIVFRDNRAFRATLNEAMRVSGVEATEPWHAHHLVPIGGGAWSSARSEPSAGGDASRWCSTDVDRQRDGSAGSLPHLAEYQSAGRRIL